MRRALPAVLVLALLAGCGASVRDTARDVVVYAAHAGSTIDRSFAQDYARAAAEALQAAESAAEYRAAMEPWDAVTQALATLRGVLLTAESALDSWEAGGEQRWIPLAGCVLQSLVRLEQTMQVVGLPIPSSLHDALQRAEAFVGFACEGR